MTLSSKALSLRIFCGERDRWHGKPLYESIVLTAREKGLAGATVFHCPMGYGHSSLLHTTNILDLSDDLPMVVEIVDTHEKISAFLPEIDKMINGGLVIMQEVTVVKYGVTDKKK